MFGTFLPSLGRQRKSTRVERAAMVMKSSEGIQVRPKFPCQGQFGRMESTIPPIQY
jgi:hypothetical protein